MSKKRFYGLDILCYKMLDKQQETIARTWKSEHD
jgi:hypothetical protein